MTGLAARDSRAIVHPAIRRLPPCRLGPAQLARLVRELAADPGVWRPHVRHDPQQRWHKRLYWSRWVEVYVLGWVDDQDTRLHDHGGSQGAFVVTEGNLFEENGRVGDNRLRPREHLPGQYACFGADYLHNLGHRGPGTATSVHAYSPPLTVMRFYEPDVQGALTPAYQLPTAGAEPDDEATPVLLAPTSGGSDHV